MNRDQEFNQIKKELVDRIASIEKFIKDTEDSRREYKQNIKDISTRLNGDYLMIPPIIGHEQRIINLEKLETDRLKNKETAIKMAAGSLTVAIGGAVIWVFNVLRDSFIHK